MLRYRLRSGHTRSCGCLSRATTVERNRAGRQDVVGYYPAHKRVYNERGKAKQHACVDCGEPAHGWSYDHMDSDELVGRNRFGREVTYSLDPVHYSPRCSPCHTKFDRTAEAAAE